MRLILAVISCCVLVACGGGSSQPVSLGKDFGAFPGDGRADVRAYYEAIEASIASGSVVTLPSYRVTSALGADTPGEAQDLTLRLRHSDLLAPGAFYEVNGLPGETPFIRVYEGHIDGMETQLAQIVVSPGFIRGAVRFGDDVNLIRIAMKGNRPEGVSRRNEVPSHPVDRPRSGNPSNCPQDGYPLGSSLRVVPPYLSPMTGAGTDAPELRARVILDADRKVWEMWGPHTPAMMVGMLAEMDLAYRYEVGIRHTIVGLHLNLTPGYYQDPEITDPFNELARWWDNHHEGERDLLHLFTGWDSSYAQANCIGSAGTTAGYSFSSAQWEERYTSFHTNAFAHEFGHLYGAHHHYGNHAESHLATIMIQGYTPGNQPQFSSLSRAVVRGWGEEYLAPWP